MSWVGGKKALREEVVRRFPLYYERYIEVFGGGGWVLFHKNPGNDFEVYNDFNGLLTNLYHCTEGYYSNIGEDGFTEKDHIRLRDALMSIQGKFLLSYNDDPFVRELYDAPGIQIEPVTRLNNIRQRYDPNCQFAELLIANYDLHERERASVQLNLFDFDMKETDHEICKRNHFQGPPDPHGSDEALWL